MNGAPRNACKRLLTPYATCGKYASKRTFTQGCMQVTPRSIPGWTVYVLGAIALSMGVLGLISPSTQLEMMGFERLAERAPGDYTPAVLAITSLAAVNTATLYMVASVMEWRGFLAWAVVARLVMGTGLSMLVLAGVGPKAFVGAAGWEAIGAALIAAVGIWKHQRSAGQRRLG